MKEKRLSIITVNRNNAGGLAKTISSVVSQSYRDFEFIVIDGASQDESPEIIRENANHLSYWISEPDKGTYHAMNKGIQVAKGEYCLFLNSGDYLVHPTVLDKVFSHHPEADIISGDVLKIRPNGKFRRVSSPLSISLHKLCIHSLPHQATLIRTSLFKEIGYYTESYKIASDWEFFLKALVIHEKSYMHIDEDVSYFRIGGISSTEENFELAYQESQDCLKKHFPRMEEDLMEYRYFYNSNIGQVISLIKKKKKLYKFIDDAFGLLMKSKKTLAGK
jgi:glycosyltransferase involved in cell wall biosynthesis